MKRCIWLVALLLMASLYSVAQEEPLEELEEKRGFDKSKLFIGGNFGLSFGNTTMVNVSPQLGYRFNRWLAAGTGLNFQYASFKQEYYNGSTYSRESYGVVGLNIFGRVYPIQQILLQVQPEMNYTWGNLKIYGPPDQKYVLDGKTVPSLLLGAGGVLPAGRGGFIIMAQYDVLQHERTPYGNKVFYNFGYNVGLF